MTKIYILVYSEPYNADLYLGFYSTEELAKKRKEAILPHLIFPDMAQHYKILERTLE